MSEVTEKKLDDYGKVIFADDVVATIAGLAAVEVPGVASMSSGIAEMFGKKSHSRGVKVEVGEKETAIDLYVVVEYGVRIPEVAWNIQENVKKAVETMTGLKVVEVNIYIQGVNFPKESKQPEVELEN